MPFIDDFSPSIVGADRLKLQIDPSTLPPTAGRAVIINVDASATVADGGIVLPVEVVIQAPTVAGSSRVVQRGQLPAQVSLFPISGGSHMVMVREIGHNQFFGAITFDVAGDEISSTPRRGLA